MRRSFLISREVCCRRSRESLVILSWLSKTKIWISILMFLESTLSSQYLLASSSSLGIEEGSSHNPKTWFNLYLWSSIEHIKSKRWFYCWINIQRYLLSLVRYYDILTHSLRLTNIFLMSSSVVLSWPGGGRYTSQNARSWKIFILTITITSNITRCWRRKIDII